MGLFDVFKISGGLDKVLIARGIQPRSLPAKLHSQIGSYISQKNSRSMFKSEGNLIGIISCTSEHVACCILGPTKYLSAGGRSDFCEVDRIAEDWQKLGPEGTLETAVLRAINEAGMLNEEYARLFKSHLEA